MKNGGPRSKIVNRMFKKQRNVLLFTLLNVNLRGFYGFHPLDGPNDSIKVTSDLSWEKMYYDMKKQRDSMEVERMTSNLNSKNLWDIGNNVKQNLISNLIYKNIKHEKV